VPREVQRNLARLTDTRFHLGSPILKSRLSLWPALISGVAKGALAAAKSVGYPPGLPYPRSKVDRVFRSEHDFEDLAEKDGN
jgi:hypothetical protein